MVTREAVEEFRRLYREYYGIELTFEEARVRAEALINLYRAVCADEL